MSQVSKLMCITHFEKVPGLFVRTVREESLGQHTLRRLVLPALKVKTSCVCVFDPNSSSCSLLVWK